MASITDFHRIFTMLVNAGNTTPGEKVGAVLVRALSEDGKAYDRAERHVLYTQLVELGRKAFTEVEDHYDIDNLHPKAAEKHPSLLAMRRALNLVVDNHAGTTVNHFKDFRLDTLDILAVTIEPGVGETASTDEMLSGLRDQLLTLEQEILSGDLPAPLKHACLQAVQRLLKAITTYRVFGSSAIDRAVGELFTDVIVTGKGSGKAGWAILDRLLGIGANLVTVTHGAGQMLQALPNAGQSVTRLLTGGS